MKTVSLFPGQEDAYEVLIGSRLLDSIGERMRALFPKAASAAVFTDSHVGPLCLERTQASLQEAGFAVFPHVFPAGEASKNLSVYMEFLHHLAVSGMTRSDPVVALGGGVTGDMAGFAAATWLRGVPYVQIPTSLLAAVDSSVGGKTAVDLPEGKNLVGAFKQPSLVLCDTDLLSTLPEREWVNGMAEVLKYGILYDEDFFESLRSPLSCLDMEEVIRRCVMFKADAVRFDEQDHGARQFLNLGHTLGHAVESLSCFTVPHGFAVAAGMVLIARAGEKLGVTQAGTADRIAAMNRFHGLPEGTSETAEDLFAASLGDKKRNASGISVIVPETIGVCEQKQLTLEQWKAWVQAGKDNG